MLRDERTVVCIADTRQEDGTLHASHYPASMWMQKMIYLILHSAILAGDSTLVNSYEIQKKVEYDEMNSLFLTLL